MDLLVAARSAIEKTSDIEIGLAFSLKACPDFAQESNDRLWKLGRRVRTLVADEQRLGEDVLGPSLQYLVRESQLIASGDVKVPTVPFGKTKLDMPIVTLGCMRFQQEWGPRITELDQVGSDCQDNLVRILKQAIAYGMVHIETARGYGCSELQLGVALEQLMATGVVQRSDLLIQTKVAPMDSPDEFRETLETSFKNLKVDYLDLFAFHGINMPEDLENTVGKDGNNCMAVIQEYVQAGKIRHVGFSTHGSTEIIVKAIETDAFDYVNLHYHYFGSYTASGGGHEGNLEAVALLAKKNMGIFIISPFDKGGALYMPSKKLRALTLPEMEPMDFQSWWLWNHHELYPDGPHIHTYTLGAARAADLDQAAVAAHLHATEHAKVLDQTRAVTQRLDAAKEEALGKAWVASWWKGLPKAETSKYQIEHNQVVWLHNLLHAFGMLAFAKCRYGSLQGNREKWDNSLSPEENISKIGRMWGFVPGLSIEPSVDYSDDLKDVPAEQLNQVREAERWVHSHCAKKPSQATPATLQILQHKIEVPTQLMHAQRLVHNQWRKLEAKVKKGDWKAEPVEVEEVKPDVPSDWETAYDLRPWPDFPDQPSRA